MKEMVKNVPAYAKDYPVWIVTECGNDLWFYGAFRTEERNKANEIAMAEGRMVIVD